MTRPELGTKRICPTTGRKFYDLGKDPVISPYSGEVVPITAAAGYSRGAAPIVARKEAPAEEDETERDGPELVSLDEVEAEEAEKDTDADADPDGTSEDDLGIEDEDDGVAVDDDNLTVDEDDDDTNDLVDVNGDEDDQ